MGRDQSMLNSLIPSLTVMLLQKLGVKVKTEKISKRPSLENSLPKKDKPENPPRQLKLNSNQCLRKLQCHLRLKCNNLCLVAAKLTILKLLVFLPKLVFPKLSLKVRVKLNQLNNPDKKGNRRL